MAKVVAHLRDRFRLATSALVTLALLLAACQDTVAVIVPTYSPSADTPSTSLPVAPTPHKTRVAIAQPPASPTPLPTSTSAPEPTAPLQPSPTATATPISLCSERMPADGLSALVTEEYGLSPKYVPPSLVKLSSYLPVTVTLGYPTQIREIVAEPLVEMISDMHAAGLRPTIISGYRSYAAQSIAWTKWHDNYPDRASIISAPPGHSEHQLGTTIDFGSPELPELVGDEDIEFHTNFYLTSEGQWLGQHAHEYGFVLSYPRETFELTGMYYEPWHFRYVGQEIAAMLKDEGISLISYLTSTQPPPCIP